MSARERRTKRRHRIVKACLMQCYDIHVALTQKELVFPRAPCYIKSVKITALIKYLCLRRV